MMRRALAAAGLCLLSLPARAQEAPLSFEVAVVHVEPTTQVVFKQSAPARFTPTLLPGAFRIQWSSQRIIVPFAERKYDDPFVSAVRFSGDTAIIELTEPNLQARAYPLANPDRVVVEIGRPAPPPAAPPAAPPPAVAPALTIVIDAGHGGTETGAIGPGGLQEKDATLAIARRLSASLTRVLSARVLLTRDSDSLISLDDRTALANHEKADLFLSIHANSSRATGARGSETYYLSLEASDKLAQEVANQENQAPAPAPAEAGAPPSRDPSIDFILWDLAQTAHLKESSALAETIQEELNALSGTQNRGIKQAPFRVLVGATMPAVLVETAFISNAEEEKKLANAAFQQSVADAIAKAISRFFARRKPGAIRPAPAATPPAAVTP
jgi:N-acetylmuramoyl-L-alanine amidase